MEYGIIGGGPAGSWTARCLAEAGKRVVMWEKSMNYEKPCGGGITEKVFRRFPELLELPVNYNEIKKMQFGSPRGHKVSVELRYPLRVVNRNELQTVLIQSAVGRGARLLTRKVLALRRRGSGWMVVDTETETYVDFLVLADGALGAFSPRFVGRIPNDLYTQAYSCCLPEGGRDVLSIQFYADFIGYHWEFPRWNTTAAGIAYLDHKRNKARAKSAFRNWLLSRSHSHELPPITGHRIPAFDAGAWRTLRTCGPDWAAVGDSGGYCDVMTGEGLYYAFLSAALLAECLNDGSSEEFARRRRELSAELELSAAFRTVIYHPDVMELLVGGLGASKTFRNRMHDVLEGNTSYERVAIALLLSLPMMGTETLFSAPRVWFDFGRSLNSLRRMKVTQAVALLRAFM